MRAQSLTRRLKTKFWQGNVVPTQFEAAYLSANKLRTQFVGIPAMKHTVMDDSIFHEGVSVGSIPWRTETGLCSLGGTRLQTLQRQEKNIDVYGDNVMRSQVYTYKCMHHGDGWRTRHDAFKWIVAEQVSRCQYNLHVEPTNLFLAHITQKEGFMGQKSRKRQGLVLHRTAVPLYSMMRPQRDRLLSGSATCDVSTCVLVRVVHDYCVTVI